MEDKETIKTSVSKLRVAIIGAGPSGLAQLRAFEAASKKGSEIPQITCFEKQKDWGGLWNYSWRTGIDEYGEAVHSGMYKHLWSNGPKECLEFADYTFEEHFGKVINSYPPREVLQDYIRGRLKKSTFRNLVRFCTSVRNVTFSDETQTFSLTAHDLENNKVYSEEFDYVVCANGHFSTPNLPEFEGFNDFQGRILHSHDFRNGSDFKNLDVLIIGTSYSGEDIASHCYKQGSKTVTISYRTRPSFFNWPENFSQVPELVRADKDNFVYFKDGSKKKVDAIILCTGYLNYYPFLEDKLRLETVNRMWPMKLYKGILWEDNPKLIYIGSSDQYYTFNMFDIQAWYARDVILGKIILPSKEEMIKYNNIWKEKEDQISSLCSTLEEKQQACRDCIVFQGEHMKDLAKDTDYPPLNIDACNEHFFEWEHDKAKDILSFRDKAFKSVLTGNMAIVHHTKWQNEYDDSLENFTK